METGEILSINHIPNLSLPLENLMLISPSRYFVWGRDLTPFLDHYFPEPGWFGLVEGLPRENSVIHNITPSPSVNEGN